MTSNYTVSSEAYLKLMLHSLKFPSCETNGLLIGIPDGQGFIITDAYPLFHHPTLAPMAEAACHFIETQCIKRGKQEQIVGYYHANERIDDKGVNGLATKMADKIESNCSRACVILVDTESLSLESNLSLLLFLKDVKRGWTEMKDRLKPQDPSVVSKLTKALKKNVQNEIYDFDEHFEDLSKDWRNLHVVSLLEMNV